MGDDTLTAADLLALEPLGGDRWRSNRNQDNRGGAIFGGQTLAQALAAACATVDRWPAHNLSAMFLRGGVVAEPVDYRVERLRDGRRYASRRVLATQGGKAIFDLICSFHDAETGMAREVGGLSGVPPPEQAVDLRAFCAANTHRLPPPMVYTAQQSFPIELRLVDPEAAFFGGDAALRQNYWCRVPSAASISDPRDQQCLLAFASDFWLACTASAGYVLPPGGRNLRIASLNHSFWFHGAVDTSDWMLFRSDSPWAGEGRGLARALIYDRTGRLVASAAQEISLRVT